MNDQQHANQEGKGVLFIFFAVCGVLYVGSQLGGPPAPITGPTMLDKLETVGTVATTTDGLDCYGDEEAVANVTRARSTDDLNAESVHVAEEVRSQWLPLTADQQFTVIRADGGIVRVQINSGPWPSFAGHKCWINAVDAALVTK